jgi:hypothetical protein
VVAERKAVSS